MGDKECYAFKGAEHFLQHSVLGLEKDKFLISTLKNFLNMIYVLIYTKEEVSVMDIAKVFMNGRSQAVRLPKEYRFNESDVLIKIVAGSPLKI